MKAQNISREILVGVSIDAVGSGRLPELLAAAGLRVTVVSPQGLALLSSRQVAEHVRAGSSPDQVRQSIEAHLALHPEAYSEVLIADEPLLRAFLDHPASPALGRLCPVVANTSRLARLLSKVAFAEDSLAFGVPIPGSRILRDREELEKEAWRGQPFVLKLDHTMSGSGVHVIRSEADLQRVVGDPGVTGPMLIQDFVAGRVGATGVIFREGRPVCWFSYFLCRNWPNPVAASSAIEVCWLPEIEDILNKIGRMTEFEGLCGIDWVLDHVTGKPLVLEMNPRPTPGMYVSVLAGVSFSQTMAALRNGVEEAQKPVAGSRPMYRLFPQHLFWAIDEHRPVEFLRTWANAPWSDPLLLASQLRRVATHYLPSALRSQLRQRLRKSGSGG